MRLYIDTEREAIIVPDTFYGTIDKQNQILADNGVDMKVDYTNYVKAQFNKAITHPMLRMSDVRTNRRRGKVQQVSVKELADK